MNGVSGFNLGVSQVHMHSGVLLLNLPVLCKECNYIDVAKQRKEEALPLRHCVWSEIKLGPTDTTKKKNLPMVHFNQTHL